jgi:polysaccharide biosynthesis protein PslH
MGALWITRAAPFHPLIGGDIEYSRRLIGALAEHCPVEVLAFSHPLNPTGQWPNASLTTIDRTPPPIWASLASPLPNVAFQHQSDAFAAEAIGRGRRADMIVVDHIGMAWLVEVLKRALPDGPPVIAITHNHESRLKMDIAKAAPSLPHKAFLALDGWKAAQLERRSCRAADGITVITETDRETFGSEAPGVPALLLMPGYDGPARPVRTIAADSAKRVTIIGSRMAYYKRLILIEILDAIQAARLPEDIIVDVVGDMSDFSPAQLAKYDRLTFRGYVDDLSAYLDTARLALIPDVLGGGFKLRALPLVFGRVPILSVRAALAGMQLQPGRDFETCETVSDLVAAIAPTVNDVDRLNALQENAYRAWDGRFAWSGRGGDLLAFAESLRAAPTRQAA